MNIFDVVIILCIALVGVIGLKRGIIKEAVVLIGTILVICVAFWLKDPLAAFLCKHLPFFHLRSGLGVVTSLNIIFYQLIAFLLLVILLLFLLRILIHVSGFLSKIVNATIILALPNQLLGLLLGLIEGYIIVFLALNILAVPLGDNALFVDSGVRQYIMNESPILNDQFGGINRALEDIMTLEEGGSQNENDLKVIDIMLKYKVVSVDFMEEVKETGKLDSIVGIDAVINKYKEE